MVLALSVTAVGCGSDDDDDDDPIPQQAEEQNDEGIYRASLSALNSQIAGETSGQTIVRIRDGKIDVYIGVEGAPENISHVQHIHAGTSCPTAAADANSDGFIDVVEGVPSYGPILVNLDADLSSFAASSMNFPTANGSGAYVYKESADFEPFLADLRRTDDNPEDAIVTLGPDESLNLASRHVVIHGVPTSANLPDTVQSVAGLPSTATLPIACGELVRVSAEEEVALEAILDAIE